MRIFSIISFVIVLSFSAFAREKYTVGGAKVQSNGELCIIEYGVGFAGSVGNCSDDKISGQAKADLNQRVERIFGDLPTSLMDSFLASRPRHPAGGGAFKISDFTSYLDTLEKNTSCKSGLTVYKQRKAELERELERLNQSFTSNTDTLKSACTISGSAAVSEGKGTPAEN